MLIVPLILLFYCLPGPRLPQPVHGQYLVVGAIFLFHFCLLCFPFSAFPVYERMNELMHIGFFYVSSF